MSLPFENASFDKIIGNYILHLVPDPDKMLLESKRVLKEGGMCAFSVWGRKENSPKFTMNTHLIPKFSSEWNIDFKEEVFRSSFHLSDINDLKRRVLQAGFTRCIAWYQQEILSVTNGEEYADGIMTGALQTKKFCQKLNEEQRIIFRKAQLMSLIIYLKRAIQS